MAIEIKMPALSPTMTEGRLSRWLVAQGDSVASGDVIAEIETDKATMEVEAIDEGTIGAIHIGEGTDGVVVGAVIATLLEEGESEVPPIAETPAPVAEAAPEMLPEASTEASTEAPRPEGSSARGDADAKERQGDSERAEVQAAI